MRHPSIETSLAVVTMQDYYCNKGTKCLPRGSYRKIAEEIGFDERIVSKNARLQEMAHVHCKVDNIGNVLKMCWICKKRCSK